MNFGTSNREWAIAGIIVLGVAIAAGWWNFTAVKYTANDLSQVGTQLLTLVFIALVIERAVEVYVNNQFGGQELEARREIRIAQADVAMMEGAVTEEAKRAETLGAAADPAHLKAARDKLRAASEELLIAKAKSQPDLEDLLVKKRATSAMCAVFLGLIVAASGVRIFADLVAIGDKTAESLITNPLQANIFRSTDILVTALLLAGGADGIHQILKRFVVFERDFKT